MWRACAGTNTTARASVAPQPSGRDVPDVDRIERAAEHAEARHGRHADGRPGPCTRPSCVRSVSATPLSSSGMPSPVTAETGRTATTARAQVPAAHRRAPDRRPRRSCCRDNLRLVASVPASNSGSSRGSRRSPRPDRAPRRRDIHQVDQHLGSLEVAQERVAEPVACVRAFDQAGNVGDDEAPIVAQVTTPRFGVSVVNG